MTPRFTTTLQANDLCHYAEIDEYTSRYNCVYSGSCQHQTRNRDRGDCVCNLYRPVVNDHSLHKKPEN